MTTESEQAAVLEQKSPRPDPYIDWPYATAYLLNTLDPELIEGHANQILCRALNVGRTIAFVGAGVSMAYGRMSWRNLVNTQVDAVIAKLDDTVESWGRGLEARGRPHDRTAFLGKHGHVRRLARVLHELRGEDGLDVKPDRYPMMFQLCEELDKALNHIRATECASDLPAQPSMRATAMRLTRDESGHARENLLSAFDARELDKSKTPPDEKKAIKQERGKLEERLKQTWRQIYTAEGLTSLIEALDAEGNTDAGWAGVGSLRTLAEKVCRDARFRAKSGATAFLLPTERYLVGALARLLGPSSERGWWSKLTEPSYPQPDTEEAPKRQDLSPRSRDPLLQILERLQINRFITTNYDREIDRLFEDRLFRQSVSQSPPSLLRPRSETIVFRNEDASRLMVFAAQDRGRSGRVVHLHGRAGEGADDRIIVTEADYQSQYLGPGEHRDMADDAIRLAFGGNPILFVGSNMGEDDILRPLRQFMSTPSRVGDRVAIALIPAYADRRKRVEEKIALLGRYGVYTIHFGTAANRPEILQQDDGEWTLSDADAASVEWMPWVWKLREKLLEFLLAIEKQDEPTPALMGLVDKLEGALRQILKHDLERTPAGERIERTPIELLEGNSLATGMITRGDIPRLTTPEYLEGVRAKPGDGLSLEVDVAVINACIEWATGLGNRLGVTETALPKVGKWKRLQAEARAHRVALEGAGDSIMAVFTSARLIRTHWHWDDWKNDWFKLPTPRTPQFTTVTEDGTAYVYRHRISRSAEPGEDPSTGRFYDGAPSHTYYNLLAALESTRADRYRAATKRRVLIVAGRRGVGKGHFFNALESSEAKDDGIPKAKQFMNALGGGKQQWKAAGFYNLSFAHEVMSVFDGISDFLHDARKGLGPPITPRGKDPFDTFTADRAHRLDAAMAEWASLAQEPEIAEKQRVLIAINSIGVLFDSEGNPKNGQVKRLFNILMDERHDAAPIDIVLVCQDTNLPIYFRGGQGRDGLRPLVLSRPTGNSKSALATEYLYQDMGIELNLAGPSDPGAKIVDLDWRTSVERRMAEPWRSGRLTVSSEKPITPPVSERVAIHLMHETRAAVITTSYFPRVAMLLARQSLHRQPAMRTFLNASGDESEPPPAGSAAIGRGDIPHIFEQHAMGFRRIVRSILNSLRPDGRSEGARGLPPKLLFPPAVVLLWLMTESNAVGVSEGDLERKFEQLVKAIRKRAGPDATEVTWEILRDVVHGSPADVEGVLEAEELSHLAKSEKEKIREVLQGSLPGGKPLDLPAFIDADVKQDYRLSKELHEAAKAFDKQMQTLHNAVGGGRLLLTLLMVSGYEITTELARKGFGTGDDKRYRPKAKDEVKDIADHMERHLERAILALRTVSERRRSDVVIDLVLSLLRRHHDNGRDLPLPISLPDPAETTVSRSPTLVASPAQYHLMMEVIWHLSVIGQPTEPDVLAWCPRIQDACRALAPKAAFEMTDFRECVQEILKLAVNRCLVFRLWPEGGAEEAEGGEGRLRYAVHRQVQRYVFEKLGAPSVEFTDADQFTLSLFATQPDDLPRLSHAAHKDLSRVIEALSGYPGAEDHATRFRDADESGTTFLRRRLLRAAFGIMRSIYSVAVLARFNDTAPEEDGTPGHEGYFEEHRRRVRWLIRAAVEFNPDPPSELGGRDHATSPDTPFYAEEIVWLYNECAVLSLVQGRLPDAQALLDTALAAAKRIEPNDSGALHVRLMLNKAVVDIERGQGRGAVGYLTRIADMVGEHPVPPIIATGYLGLVAHLGGEVDTAIKHYDRAIASLVDMRRSRAASIFSRHRGDLLRNLRTPRVDDARQSIENALHLAKAGAHEDIWHMAALSLVKHRIDHAGSNERPDLHRQLDDVERYARNVGMPRLLCEANLLRASLLLTQGETRLAGSLVSQSLEIASMNDLKLHKIKGLLLLAQIAEVRGLAGMSQPLFSLGEQMAKSANSHFALTHASRGVRVD